MGNPLLEMLFEANQPDDRKKREREAREQEHQAEIMAAEEELDQARESGEMDEEDPEAVEPEGGEELPIEGGEEEVPPEDADVGDPGDLSDLPDFDGSEGDTTGLEGDDTPEPGLDDSDMGDLGDLGGEEGGADEDGLDPGTLEDTPAPDGLPEADDQSDPEMPDPDINATGDEDSPEDDRDAVQINILNLSRLDRALAKDYILHQINDLRTIINSTLSTIDYNEAKLEPDIRDRSIRDLNLLQNAIKQYLKYKFQLDSYEEAFNKYAFFIQNINDIVENINNDGFAAGNSKHNNKNDPRSGSGNGAPATA